MENLKSQILSKKCSTHPFYNCDILLLDPEADKHIVCIKCLMEKQQIEKITPIAELLGYDQSSKVFLYPLTENNNLKEIQKAESDLKLIFTGAEEYYSKLENSIQLSLKKLISQDFQKLRKYKEEWDQSCTILNNMLSVRTLQELLLSQDQDSEKNLHEYVVKRIDLIESQMIQINENYLKIKNDMSYFCLEQPHILQSLIIKQIQQINIFGKQEHIQIVSEEVIQELRIKITQFENTISHLKQENNQEKQKIQILEQNQQACKEKNDKLNNDFSELLKRISSLSQEVECEKLKNQACNAEKDKLYNDNAEQQKIIASLKQEIESEKQKTQSCKAKKNKLNNDKVELQQRIASFQQEAESEKQKIQAYKAKKNKLNNDKVELQNIITALQKEVEIEKQKTEAFKAQEEKLNYDNEEQQKRIVSLQQEIESEKIKTQASKAEKVKLNNDNSEQQKRITGLQKEIELQKQKIQTSKAEKDKLNNDNAEQQKIITTLQKEVVSEKQKTQACKAEKDKLNNDNVEQQKRINSLLKEVEYEKQKTQAYEVEKDKISNAKVEQQSRILALQEENDLEKEKNIILRQTFSQEIDILQNRIFSNILCLPSKFEKSDANVQIETILNQIQIKNISSSETSYGQCYFLPELKKNRNYIISLTLNNQSDLPADFYFGLLPSKYKDDLHISRHGHGCYGYGCYGYGCYGYDSHYSYAYYRESGANTTNIIKGTELHSNKAIKIGTKRLEFRINLEQKVFKVSSPPSYLNVVQVKHEGIKDFPYQFTIDVQNSGDYVIIEYMIEVEFFNSQM